MNIHSPFSKYPILYSITSALLLIAAWPPSPLGWLLFVAFIPLIHLVINTFSLKKVFYYSFCTFYIYQFITMFWAIKISLGMGIMELTTTLFFAAIFTCILSLPIVFFSWTFQKIKHPFVWIILPVYYVSYEFFNTKWDLALAWYHLGLGLSKYPLMIQFYELTGESGGTLLVLIVNVMIYHIILHWNEKEKRLKLIGALFSLVLLISFLNFFLYKSNPSGKEKINVAIIQPNVNSREAINQGLLQKQTQLITQLCEQHIQKDKKIDLIVCSEGFLTSPPDNPIIINDIDSNSAFKQLKNISIKYNAPVITGFIGLEIYNGRHTSASAVPTGDGRYYDMFNAAAFITPDQPTQIYTKTMLVPFMERVPFLDKFSFMEKLRMDLNQAKMSYGKKNTANIFSYRNMHIAPVICIEATFSEYVRTLIQKEANMIAIISDDGWSGHTNGPYQIFSYSSPLAIAFRKNIVRSANTGISATIDVQGKAIQKSEYGKSTVILSEITLNNKKTFFERYGNVLGWITTIISVLTILLLIIRKKYLKYIPVILLFFCSLNGIAQDSKPPATSDEVIASLLKTGNYKCDSAAVHLKKKDTKGATKFYEEAIKDYKKAVKINSVSVEAYYRLAIAQGKIKDFKNSIISFDKAIDIDSTKSHIFKEKGIMLFDQGKFDEAKRAFDKAISINFEDAESFYYRGVINEKGKDPQPAFADYGRALEILPKYENVYMRRGVLYYNVKQDYVLALSDLNKVLEINPDNNEAYFWRGKTKYSGGDNKGADKDLSRYIEYEPENIEAYIIRGAARINIKNNTGAIQDYDEVIKKDSKNFIAYTNRGIAKGATKNFTGALEDFDTAIKLKFDYSPAYINRAAVKFASGDKKGACRDLEKADGLNDEKAYSLIQQYCKDGNR